MFFVSLLDLEKSKTLNIGSLSCLVHLLVLQYSYSLQDGEVTNELISGLLKQHYATINRHYSSPSSLLPLCPLSFHLCDEKKWLTGIFMAITCNHLSSLHSDWTGGEENRQQRDVASGWLCDWRGFVRIILSDWSPCLLSVVASVRAAT